VAIGLGGILLLTRLIGPEAYGLFSAAQTVLSYLVATSEVGLGIYLIRLEEGAQERAFDQAFSLLLVLSAAGVLLAWAAMPLITRLVPIPGMRAAALTLVLGLPIVHLIKVPMARLENRLDYRRVAFIELAGLAAYYVTALTLAFRGWKVGAPLAGWWAQYLLQLGFVYRTGYRPSLVWDPPLIRQMVRYGLSYSVSLWIQQLRTFVNPVVVGRHLGAAGVGYVALAIRLVEQLGFVKTATSRISIAALARLQGDPARLARAMSEGMTLQLLAVGPLFIGFALFAPFLVPIVFGPKWLPMLEPFPLIAAGYLVSSMFLLHISTLIVLRRNVEVALFTAANIATVGTAAWFLVPRIGLSGYGWAEVIGIPTYLVLHHLIGRAKLSPSYGHPLLWGVAFSAPLLVGREWLPFAWPVALLPLLWPPVRRELRTMVDLVLRRGRGEEREELPDAALVAASTQEERFQP